MRLSPSETPPGICAYASEVLTARLERMLSHIDGVRRSEETEPVHQMRVWSRRTRAALDIFEGCFSGKEYRLLQREVKAVTSALGTVRDLDVMITTLEKRAAALPAEQRAGVTGFVEQLRERRTEGQKEVEKAMAYLERNDLLRLLETLVEAKSDERGFEGLGADGLERR